MTFSFHRNEEDSMSETDTALFHDRPHPGPLLWFGLVDVLRPQRALVERVSNQLIGGAPFQTGHGQRVPEKRP